MDKKSNRLINEKSPYLLQHAHNPVDWYPWNEEAFHKAKSEDKPIFLSIGYSTCHWCHVMEKDSFEDEEIAAVLNKYFIAIKVDREQRPDIDHIYITACQRMTGSAGWPLTIIMTPDKKPFFAGTYIPKTSKWGRKGLLDILREIHDKWQHDRNQYVLYSQRLANVIRKDNYYAKDELLSLNSLTIAFNNLEAAYDEQYGGFGTAPKFPIPHTISFLLYYYYHTKNKKALQMAEKSLTSMRSGGIYDHLGYGFARYSVDNKWLAPHFEKMLYDNALLIITYLEAYQCTNNEAYAETAQEIIEYILRDMTGEQGSFYSAEDADSEGVEGKFYLWSYDEIISLLGKETGQFFCTYFNITPNGNFEHQKNIIHTIGSNLHTVATKYSIIPAKLEKILKCSLTTLYSERNKRPHPFKDKKILTGWNALMIAALARAGRILGKSNYVRAAQKATEYIKQNLMYKNRLLATSSHDNKITLAYLDDYAYLSWAYIELFETTFDREYLTYAKWLAQEMINLFWDKEQGGFFFNGHDSEMLIARPKTIYDGALPSGNSVAALVLTKLADYCRDDGLKQTAEKLLHTFLGTVNKAPDHFTYFLLALYRHLAPPLHYKIKGDRNTPSVQAAITKIQHEFMPNSIIVFYHVPTFGDDFEVHVCRNFACLPLITTLKNLQKHLDTDKASIIFPTYQC